MGTVNVEQSSGQSRRPLDREINLIPMIDLLLCCVSFLLITAVWSHMSRVDLMPKKFGGGGIDPPPEAERVLHIDMRSDQNFQLAWKAGPTVLSTATTEQRALVVGDGDLRALRYPDLAGTLASEWRSHGNHFNGNDGQLDRAVIHTAPTTPFEQVIAVIDAVHTPKRDVQGSSMPVFEVTLATD